MNRNRLKNSIRAHEGCIDHMYLDTRGNVTIGIGQLVPSADDAKSLKLYMRDSGEPADDQQIVDEYNTVMAQQAGLAAQRYKQFTKLELRHGDIEAMLDHHIDEFAGDLDREISGFEQFPDAAQEALMDMAFNLGVSGLVHKFPKLINAASHQDWDTCAAECERRGIGDDRNRATRALFDSAKSG